MKTLEEKKMFIKEMGKCSRVIELVDGLDFTVEDAVDYVYDMLILTKEQFRAKYIH